MNLPKSKLNRIYRNKSELSRIKFWYLFWRGKTYLKDDTFFTKLWLIDIRSSKYPITEFGHNKIAIEVLTVNIQKYIQGSVYDTKGNCISEPIHDANGLSNIEVSINPREDYANKGLYRLLSNNNYPTTDYKFEVLKGASFYLKKIDLKGVDTSLVLPLQIVIDFFFFNYSTKLNNYILDNTITDLFEVKGEVVNEKGKYGYLVQNGQEISKKLMLLFARYYFTKGNSGIKALNDLRSKHLLNLMNGDKETYLYTNIPFSFDCTFNLVGQYLGEQKELFLASRITGFKPTNGQKPFDVDELIVSVINDTRSSQIYNNHEVKGYNKVNNEYTGISGNEVDHSDSDGSGNLIEIEIEEQPFYSFNEIPENRKIPKGSARDKYVQNKIINGNKFSGGTVNLRGLGGEENITKIDEITVSRLLRWNVYALNAIKKFCKKNRCSGIFVKIGYQGENISLEEYEKGYLNVFTSFRTRQFKRTKFILFEFSVNNDFYYFFEQGSGSYSAVFRARNRMKFSKNDLNLIFLNLVSNKKIMWSKRRRDKSFLIKNNLHILQPIEHPGVSEISLKNTEEYRVDKLVKTLENRIFKDIMS